MNTNKYFLMPLLLFLIGLSIPAFSQLSQELTPRYESILKLKGEEKHTLAIARCKELVSDYPFYSKAYKQLVEVSKLQNSLTLTQTYLTALETKRADNPYIYYGLGLIFEDTEEYEKALNNFQKCITLVPNFADAYSDYGLVCKKLNKTKAALDFLSEKSKQNAKSYGLAYGLGYLYFTQYQWDGALNHTAQALLLKPDFWQAYQLKYRIYDAISDYSNALNAALEMEKLTQGSEIEAYASALNDLGEVYKNTGQYDKALRTLQNALQISNNIGAKEVQLIAMSDLGVIYRRKSNFKRALQYQFSASDLAKKLGNRHEGNRALGNIGVIYDSIGDNPQALNYYQKALKIAEKLGDRFNEGIWNGNIGNIFYRMGNYGESLSFHLKSKAIAEEISDTEGIETELGNIGVAYLDLGRFLDAKQNFEKALEVARTIQDKEGEEIWLSNLGIAYQELGDSSSALKYYYESLKLAEKSGKGDILVSIGNLYLDSGDYVNAQKFYFDGYQIKQEVGDVKGQGDALLGLGKASLKNNQLETAKKYFSDALRIGEKIEASKMIWDAYQGIASVFENQQNSQQALQYIQLAIKEIENVRNEINLEENKASFFQSKVEVYEHAIEILYSLNKQYPVKGYDLESFQYAEKAKARVWLDLIARGQILQNTNLISPGLQQRYLMNAATLEQKRNERMELKSRDDPKMDNQRLRSLEAEITVLENERARIVAEIQIKYPEFRELIKPRFLSTKEVQKKILAENQILVEYLIGEKNTYLWHITKTNFTVKLIKFGREQLARMLREVSPLFQKNHEEAPLTRKDANWARLDFVKLHELYQMILEPALEQPSLKGKELIIVPDDILFYFPFEMLVTKFEKGKPHFLIEDYPIAYSISASLLNPDLWKNSNPPRNLLAFGNPYFGRKSNHGINQLFATLLNGIFRDHRWVPLPYSEMEVKNIAQNFKNPEIIIGKEATEAKFRQEAGKFRYIHLATHYLPDDRQPMFSQIVFAQNPNKTGEDGYLHAFEVFNLNLNAELVVLSACNTALGKFSRGEGLVGISRAFMYAGTPTLVVSLWPVEDESTALLMSQFYKYLAEGENKNVALQKAKIDLMKYEGDKSGPFYWAPFILIGKGK